MLAIKENPGSMIEIAQRLQDDSLSAVAKTKGVSQGQLLAWIIESEDRCTLYRNAMKVKAITGVHETREIADGSGDAKLMIETRFKEAKFHDPATYGDKPDKSGGGVTVVIQTLSGERIAIEHQGSTLTLPAEL